MLVARGPEVVCVGLHRRRRVPSRDPVSEGLPPVGLCTRPLTVTPVTASDRSRRRPANRQHGPAGPAGRDMPAGAFLWKAPAVACTALPRIPGCVNRSVVVGPLDPGDVRPGPALQREQVAGQVCPGLHGVDHGGAAGWWRGARGAEGAVHSATGSVGVTGSGAQPSRPCGPGMPCGPGIPGGPAGPAGPTGPCSPRGPCSPGAPGRPSAPRGPCSPRSPIGPCSPTGPWSPVGPCSPVRPCSPIGPIGPIGPTGPCSPVGPGRPIGPVGPCSPDRPVRPCSPRSPGRPLSPGRPFLLATLTGQTLLAPRALLGDNRGHGHRRVGVVVERAVIRCFCRLVLRIRESRPAVSRQCRTRRYGTHAWVVSDQASRCARTPALARPRLTM